MKIFTPEWKAALAAGQVVSHGAIRLETAEGPVRVWSGYGTLGIDGEDYLGIGERGLVRETGGQIGGAAGSYVLELSGVGYGELDFDPLLIRGAPVQIWRLGFNVTGQVLLDATRYERGRVDTFTREEEVGGLSTLKIGVKGAAAAAGRALARMRSDADQRLVEGDDNAFRKIAVAPIVDLYWGGYLPERGGSALGGSSFPGPIGKAVGKVAGGNG